MSERDYHPPKPLFKYSTYKNKILKVGIQLKKSLQNTQRTFDYIPYGEEHI